MTRIVAASGPFFAVLLLAFGTPAVAATNVPNTIPCKNFIKNSDGSWNAEPMTRAFDIGTLHNYRLESDLISRGEFIIGGVDLWSVIEGKCNSQDTNSLSNSVGTFAN
ncbi:MAG TPA: hypothetical protein VL574_12590 [Stellaceae bacterium]|nr:hypothetical protein [Stellaceae bacterium]